MPQVDLIVETYVHASAEVIAPWVCDPQLPRRLWPDWRVEVAQERGEEGVRWRLNDPVAVGSTEVWIESIAGDGCVLHTFTRVDRRDRPWGSLGAIRRVRRVRARQSRELWRLKDDVERADGGRRR